MTRIARLLGLFALTAAFSTSAFAANHKRFHTAAQPRDGEVLTVVDDAGQPVPGATILLGFEQGNPFPGNTFRTDGQGVAGIPSDWKAALPLTIQAPGFIANTIPVAQPGVQTLHLTRQEPAASLEVKGTSTDFGNLVEDGKVDFGLVIPALTRGQMLSFDVSTIMSPQSDTISIIGKDIKIPSNLTLPEQTESYIFPIDLDKPDYRVYLRYPGTYQMGIAHGQFPLQRVVDDIRAGKSFLEVVNYFDFKEFGEKPVDATADVEGLDLSVNQTPFNATFAVKAPAFDANLVMMSLGLIEQNGIFLPSDVKRFKPSQMMNLKTNPSAGTPFALSLLLEDHSDKGFTKGVHALLKPLLDLMPTPLSASLRPKSVLEDFTKLSFTLLPAVNGVMPQFLPLIEKPSLDGQVLTLNMPTLPEGLSPVAMYLTLSEIETIGEGKVKVERRTRLWEIWSDAWLAQLELPKLEITRKQDRKYRWEVLFLAHPSTSSSVDLNTVTHATRNTVDI